MKKFSVYYLCQHSEFFVRNGARTTAGFQSKQAIKIASIESESLTAGAWDKKEDEKEGGWIFAYKVHMYV